MDGHRHATAKRGEELAHALTRPATLHLREGRPYPLGAHWDGHGVNFAVFSANATRIELCVFDASGQRELHRQALPGHTDEVWHGYLPGAAPGLLYGLRASGPYEPENGHRFNPNKLLIDPYARSLVGPLIWGPEIFGYTIGSDDLDLSMDPRDSARCMPKCCVVDNAFDWRDARHPDTAWDHSVLYEMHVRGYTKLDPQIPEAQRGSLAALAHPRVIGSLRELGITAVELLPIHAFVDEGHLVERDLRNYWGYNSIGFFAPAPRYLSTGSINEFKEAVRSFHEAGIEVLLDVVYNHTAEGNELGPTLSFKGLDNASYYRLQEERRYYINDTGTGNTLNMTNPRTLQMVADSLRYWVQEMHVDGFRFDLATILGREPEGFDQQSGFLDVCRQDPVLARVKLIAEPWDCGPGGYQVGNFPPGWAEWNDRYRDVTRSFWKGDFGRRGEIAARLCGSADIFNHRGRKPWASINFITAHDGFTLSDLVSYNERHNEANGDGNLDGTDNNLSWNHGVEGPSTDPAIVELRARQKRNLLATLLLSQGTPMLLAGDELDHSQNGNNNAYAQDNALTWIRWTSISAEGQELRQFVRRLLALRRRYPQLRQRRFLTGASSGRPRVLDVTWLNSDGSELTQENWQDPGHRCLGMLLDGRSAQVATDEEGARTTLLLLLNAHDGDLDFRLPHLVRAGEWHMLLDTRTALTQPVALEPGSAYPLLPRSFALLSATHQSLRKTSA